MILTWCKYHLGTQGTLCTHRHRHTHQITHLGFSYTRCLDTQDPDRIRFQRSTSYCMGVLGLRMHSSCIPDRSDSQYRMCRARRDFSQEEHRTPCNIPIHRGTNHLARKIHQWMQIPVRRQNPHSHSRVHSLWTRDTSHPWFLEACIQRPGKWDHHRNLRFSGISGRPLRPIEEVREVVSSFENLIMKDTEATQFNQNLGNCTVFGS